MNRTAITAAVLLLSGTSRAAVLPVVGPATNLGQPVNSSVGESSPGLSTSGLELYFRSDRPGQLGDGDIYRSTRTAIDEPWSEPVNLGPVVNSAEQDTHPALSPDGLSLYFLSSRDRFTIFESRRATLESPWGAPQVVAGLPRQADGGPSFSADGLTLYFHTSRSGGSGSLDLWTARRTSPTGVWSNLTNLGPTINSSEFDANPSISADGLFLFFDTGRNGGGDVWYTRRASLNSPWEPAVNLGSSVSSTAFENAPEISVDGRSIFFRSDRAGGVGDSDLWIAPIRFVESRVPRQADFDTLAPGTVGDDPPQGAHRLGFATDSTARGANPFAGVEQATGGNHAMVHRSVNAVTTFDDVDVSAYLHAICQVNVSISNTFYEPADYLRIYLLSGQERVNLLMAGAGGQVELNDLAGLTARPYRVQVPDHWTEASLVIESLSDSSQGAEQYSFDNIFFEGAPIPVPGAFLLTALSATTLRCRSNRVRADSL